MNKKGPNNNVNDEVNNNVNDNVPAPQTKAARTLNDEVNDEVNNDVNDEVFVRNGLFPLPLRNALSLTAPRPFVRATLRGGICKNV